MSDRSTLADQAIRKHVAWSVGAGLVPIPLADFVAVTAIQVDLIRQLATLYGVPYSEATGKMLVGALTGSTLARIGSSVIKAIPGVGTVLGGLSMSIASGASTYAVGQVVKSHLSLGGTLSDVNVEEARKQYQGAYQEGERVAREAKGDKAADVTARLEKLAELKAKGLVTEAEYEAKKARLLEEL